jgi:hypothetical protein
MNDRVPITRDFNLNFSIEEVKKSIEIVSTLSKATFTINNKNDIFNTYTMTLVGGITVISPNIQLKKISDTETNLVITCNYREGNTISSNEVLDKFFNLVGMSLSGETIDEKLIADNKAGCFTIIIGILGLSSSLIYYIVS